MPVRKQNNKKTRDVHADITNYIVKAIEDGAGSYKMPWHRDGANIFKPENALTGNAYPGVNVITLWVSAEQKGYGSGVWATYAQWKTMEAQVRAKEKGSPVVFYKDIAYESADAETGEAEEKHALFARTSWVFNADQVENYSSPKPHPRNLVEIVDKAEAFVTATGADIRYGGDKACYLPSQDYIRMPDKNRFTGTETSTPTETFYSVLCHELTHFSGHPSRLDRNLRNRYGDQAYAMEELIAELGAAYLCADLGVTNSPRPDHAAYLSNWLTVIKSEKRAIFTAASKASQAAEYLAGKR